MFVLELENDVCEVIFLVQEDWEGRIFVVLIIVFLINVCY